MENNEEKNGSKRLLISYSPNDKDFVTKLDKELEAECYGKKILPIMIDKECWKELHSYRELSNMRDLSVLNFVNNIIFGLPVIWEDHIKKLISAINNENTSKI